MERGIIARRPPAPGRPCPEQSAGRGEAAQRHRIHSSSLPGVRGAKYIAQAVTSGDAGSALASVPAPMRAHVALVAKASFVSGLNDILVVGAIVAAVGAVLAAVLVRRKDFVASGQPGGQPADAEPAAA